VNEEQHLVLEQLIAELEGEPVPADPAAGVPEDLGDVTVRALLYALLRYDATSTQAINAAGRIRAAVVDLNELRIAYPDEIAGLLGPRYPGVMARAERIRAVLCHVFKNESEISLARLYELPKREARTYLESLVGVTPFVAHRVALGVFSIHCVPVDSRLVDSLVAAEALDMGTPPADAAGSLERAIRATDSWGTFLRLEAWAEAGGPTRKTGHRPTKAATEPKAPAAKGR
jgi:hypothetical protein